jgi:hypothetical protein
MELTLDNAKKLIDYIGIDITKVKDETEFNTAFDTDFIRTANITEDSEPVKKILGKTFGTLENEIKKVAKEFEVEVDFDVPELKDKKVKDKLKHFVSLFAGKQKTIIDDLTAKAGQGNDEKVKEWEKKFEKESQKAKDLKGLLDTTTSEYNSFKESAGKDLKGVKINIHQKDAFSKLKLRPDISEIEKRGFNSMIAETYNFDLDENESFIVTDKKGARIPSKKVTGTFKTVDEILEEEAINAKVFQLNPDGGKPKPRNPLLPNPPAQGAGTKKRTAATPL